MTVTVGAFEAKTHLSELLARVEAGEQVMSRIAKIVEASRLVAPAAANTEEETASATTRKLSDAAEMAAAITQRAVRRLDGNAA